jgi:hypothetical protein
MVELLILAHVESRSRMPCLLSEMLALVILTRASPWISIPSSLDRLARPNYAFRDIILDWHHWLQPVENHQAQQTCQH